MPYVKTDDDVTLYYEEAGAGTPIVFVHEFAGDYRSHEPQLRFFSRRYRAIAFNARGYPPSDVPESVAQYSQQRACDDIAAVLNALDIEKAHVVGVSMGAFATLHFGLHYRHRALSLTAGGVGYGAPSAVHAQFQAEALRMAEEIAASGMPPAYASGPARVQYQNKDSRGFDEFRQRFLEHCAVGSRLTMEGVQAQRPSLYALEEAFKALSVPTLIIVGDEDEPALDTSLYLKRVIPSAALVVLPKTGHALNIEEPAWFNAFLDDFFHQVEAGAWSARDPRARTEGALK